MGNGLLEALRKFELLRPWIGPETDEPVDVDEEDPVEEPETPGDQYCEGNPFDNSCFNPRASTPLLGPSPTEGMTTEDRINYWQDNLVNLLNPSRLGEGMTHSTQSMVHFLAEYANPAGLYLLGKDLKETFESPEKREEFLKNLRGNMEDSMISTFVLLGAILGPGKAHKEARVHAGGHSYEVGVEDGAIVVNGKKWKVQGSSMKIRLGSDIRFTEAQLIPGEGLHVKVAVKVPGVLMDFVPEKLRDKVNDPDHPIEQTIPEENLEPILKELANSNEDKAEIPQLKGYPIEVVRV